jgi:uncharacterized protein (TIGR02145 family)
LTTGAWANYNNDTTNDDIYGKLYSWHAVTDGRNICPAGCHIPSIEEWTVLSNYLGTNAGFKMKSTSGWENNGTGSNVSGFNGLPGGGRFFNGAFSNVGSFGIFWSSSEAVTDRAWYLLLRSDSHDLTMPNTNNRNGFSVRCLRD